MISRFRLESTKILFLSLVFQVVFHVSSGQWFQQLGFEAVFGGCLPSTPAFRQILRVFGETLPRTEDCFLDHSSLLFLVNFSLLGISFIYSVFLLLLGEIRLCFCSVAW